MNRWIHNLSLTAAVLALLAGLWQDWGTFTVLKRTLVAYLGFFFLGAVLTLAVRAGALWEDSGESDSDSDAVRE